MESKTVLFYSLVADTLNRIFLKLNYFPFVAFICLLEKGTRKVDPQNAEKHLLVRPIHTGAISEELEFSMLLIS